jgi:putative oxidoreductase
MENSPDTRADAAKLLLRITLAVVLVFHGLFKLTHGVEWIVRLLDDAGLPGVLAYGPYLAEIVAPVLLVLGLWPRIAALIVAADMITAITLSLRSSITSVKPDGGGWGIELEFLLLCVAVALALLGGGRYTITLRRESPQQAMAAPDPPA